MRKIINWKFGEANGIVALSNDGRLFKYCPASNIYGIIKNEHWEPLLPLPQPEATEEDLMSDIIEGKN